MVLSKNTSVVGKRKGCKTPRRMSESDDAADREWRPARKTPGGRTARSLRRGVSTDCWENCVERIATISKDPITGALCALLFWRNGDAPTYHPLSDLYAKCPQLVRKEIGFHYQRLFLFRP
jgi:hypothetical protein